ncbi:hypothetical protein HY030_01615 [Candidatus Gottesmanbacteria bacterium]|nr:hypothetical protein [Candidatus Gottesmanbacteria bacterium]
MSLSKLTRSILGPNSFPLFFSLIVGIITMPILISGISVSVPFIGHAKNVDDVDISETAEDGKNSVNQFNGDEFSKEQNETVVNTKSVTSNNSGDPGAGTNAPAAEVPTPTPIKVITKPVTDVKDGAEYFVDGTEAGRDGVVAWSNCIKSRPNQSELDRASCSAEAENAYNKKAKELMAKNPQDFLERKKVDEATQKLKQYNSALTNEEIAIGAKLFRDNALGNKPSEKETFLNISDIAKSINQESNKFLNALSSLSLNEWAELNYYAGDPNKMKKLLKDDTFKSTLYYFDHESGTIGLSYPNPTKPNYYLYTTQLNINPKSLPSLAFINKTDLEEINKQAHALLNITDFAYSIKNNGSTNLQAPLKIDNTQKLVVFEFKYDSDTKKVNVTVDGLKLEGNFTLPESTSAQPQTYKAPPNNPDERTQNSGPTPTKTVTPAIGPTNTPTGETGESLKKRYDECVKEGRGSPGVCEKELGDALEKIGIPRSNSTTATTSIPTVTPNSLPTSAPTQNTITLEIPRIITIVDAYGNIINVDNIDGLSNSDIKIIKDYFKLGAFELDKNPQLGDAVIWTQKVFDVDPINNPENEKAYNAYADNFTSGTNRFMDTSNRIYDKLEARFKNSLITPTTIITSTPTRLGTAFATTTPTSIATIVQSATAAITRIFSPTPISPSTTATTTNTPTPTRTPTPLATAIATFITNTTRAIATAIGFTPSPTPTSTPTQTSTPTITATRIATGFNPEPTARALPTSVIVNNAQTGDPEASDQPDINPFGTTVGKNLSGRIIDVNSTTLNFSNQHTTGKSIFKIDSTEGDNDAPQLACLLHASNGSCILNPEITNLYSVDNWHWDDPTKKTAIKNTGKIQPNSNPKLGTVNWGVQAIGLATTDVDTIRVPGVKDGNLNNNIKVEVLFASDNTLTLRYFNKSVSVTDSVAKAKGQENIDHAFTVHLTNIAVTKDLVDRYNSNSNDVNRKYLVELKVDDILGKPIPGQEAVVAVRAAGSIMDPRVKNDWWVAAPEPVFNGLTQINTSSSITPAAGTNVLSNYYLGAALQIGDKNTATKDIDILNTANNNKVVEANLPYVEVPKKEANDFAPDLGTIFPGSPPYNIKNYNICPKSDSSCSPDEIKMIGIKPATGTEIKAPILKDNIQNQIGGGFGTMIAWISEDNKTIAINYTPDALLVPKTGYTIVLTGGNLNKELIQKYKEGLNANKFVTLLPGQKIGETNGELKVYIINDKKVANPYAFFK